MAKKRGQNEGSISKRTDGTWWARITVGVDSAGKQKRKAFYGKTRKEVQEKMTEALNDLNKGQYVESSKMYVSEWFDCWLKDYKKNQVKPTTYVNYCGKVKKHILPCIGKYKLKDLKPEIIQKTINQMVAKGLSPETVRNINNIMHDAFKVANKNGLIIKNVASGMVLPKIEKSEVTAFTIEEQNRFVEVAKNTYMGDVLLLALGTGLRIGEILALTWNDIDIDEQILRVKRTMSVVKDYDNAESAWEKQFGTPKTKSSIRSVPLLPNIVELLELVKEKQEKNKIKASCAYEDNNLVFATLMGKTLRPSKFTKNI